MQGLLEAAVGGEEAEREAAGAGGRPEALGPELAAAAQERCLTLLAALARLAGGSLEVGVILGLIHPFGDSHWLQIGSLLHVRHELSVATYLDIAPAVGSC